MIKRRILLALSFAAVLAWPLEVPANANEIRSSPELVELLRKGGLTVYIRHSVTDRSQIDTGRLHDRSGQRGFSEAGRAKAVALGQAVRNISIPIGQVLSSPVFRALDTAQLAFGNEEPTVISGLTADDYEHDAVRLAANVAWGRQRLAKASILWPSTFWSVISIRWV
ncbi:hypothetical protein J2T08_005566 [Neorhizobium galegae]|uniref:histidine phosphatase family protein n=1 Tax=Neorhizobium galegae TaxID=399 RepID=UPI002789C39B|nr:histidine phosphatase family protein [Neorhizobium galegae]MDQ0137622.1 hypothetical protein [Neorhizobium galegae]